MSYLPALHAIPNNNNISFPVSALNCTNYYISNLSRLCFSDWRAFRREIFHVMPRSKLVGVPVSYASQVHKDVGSGEFYIHINTSSILNEAMMVRINRPERSY